MVRVGGSTVAIRGGCWLKCMDWNEHRGQSYLRGVVSCTWFTSGSRPYSVVSGEDAGQLPIFRTSLLVDSEPTIVQSASTVHRHRGANHPQTARPPPRHRLVLVGINS
ncbi:unnamed protein product [Ectocarpus sp. 12 AP-2014]